MLGQELKLPSGARLSNRLIKAAMTERLADPMNRATPALETLYRTWSHGGAGCHITGNVLVDRYHLENAGNVVADTDREALTRYARAGTEAGNHLWMQISHGGRQTPLAINDAPMAPSAVMVDTKRTQHGLPVAMEIADIDRTVAAFASAARIARETGFTGVQVHAAHGYLISAFLNPLANRRDDDYGGALENRARLLLRVVDAIRAEAGTNFPLSVKLNSADFQQGGFTLEDCAQVAKWLEDAGIDLLEVSGGNYETPAMLMGRRGDLPPVKQSTLAREAFFIDYAAFLRQHTNLPMMVTGGFRTRAAMEEALASGAADAIGLGRPLCAEPDLPAKLLAGADGASDALDRIDPPWAQMPWTYAQIHRMGQGQPVDPDLDGQAATKEYTIREDANLNAWLAANRG